MGETRISSDIKELREKYIARLADLHCAPGTIKHYRCALNKLEYFMKKRKVKTYSVDVGKAFLKSKAKGNSDEMETLATTIRRLNELIERGTFALYGTHKGFKCNAHCQKQLDDFTEHLRRHEVRETSIRNYCGSMSRVLTFFYSRGIRDLGDIAPVDIYAAFESCGSKLTFTTPVRSFMRYLYKTGQHRYNLSTMVPAVRIFRPVPSVYTRTETEKMLSAIDMSTTSGLRSYAAILLALRLGIRSGDILNLKAGDIDFDAGTISFIQEKTVSAQKLELLPEIAEALTGYLAARKNPDGSPHVFLGLSAPYSPLRGNFTGMAVAKHLKIAGIDTGERKHGSHAMRATLASELASESVPYGVISRILGHENPESVKHYVKIDIDMLRKCALDAPEPTGMLADKLLTARGAAL